MEPMEEAVLTQPQLDTTIRHLEHTPEVHNGKAEEDGEGMRFLRKKHMV